MINTISAEKECPEFCPLILSPVCAGKEGSSSDTWENFGNKCALDVHNCKNGLGELNCA